MTRMDLLKTLDEWDKKGVWVFKMRDFYLLFSKENPQIIKAALARHEKSGLIERICKGVYANPRALSKERVNDVLAYVSNYIRDKGLSYLSLETVLSEKKCDFANPFSIHLYLKASKRRIQYALWHYRIHQIKKRCEDFLKELLF